MDLDMTYISQYNPKHGIKVALDGAMNLPWSNFTHVMMCLNPPGSFYMVSCLLEYSQFLVKIA